MREMELRGGGKLMIREEGDRVFFRCERTMDRDGLYKVWIQGGGGEFLLGTLAPEGERLTLSRTVARTQLYRCGCWPVRGACCRLAYAFTKPGQDTWRWEEHPEHLVDAETARVGEWGRMLVRREGEWLLLAFPLTQRRPLPLSALICLARPGKIGSENCLIWRFDREGRPVFSAENNREEKQAFSKVDPLI